MSKLKIIGACDKLISILSSTPKKRKITDESKPKFGPTQIKSADSKQSSVLIHGINKKHTESEKATFKMPEIPQKVRKVHATYPSTIDPIIIANAQIINERASASYSSQKSVTDTCSAAAGDSIPIKSHTLTHDRIENQTKANDETTEMGALFDTFIKKNAHKLTECIESSLATMLHDFWNAHKLVQQLQRQQHQMSTMRSTYERQIDQLQRENGDLKQAVHRLNGKCNEHSVKVHEMMRENIELNENLSATKTSVATLSAKLNDFISK